MAAMGADSPQEAMGWNFLQCFGERTPGEEIQEGEGGCLCGPSATLCHSVLHNEPNIQPPCHRPLSRSLPACLSSKQRGADVERPSWHDTAVLQTPIAS